jgi:hypothetical protein
VEGHNYKTAATAIGVSFNTIAFHMQNISEAASALEIGSGRQGAAQQADRVGADP